MPKFFSSFALFLSFFFFLNGIDVSHHSIPTSLAFVNKGAAFLVQLLRAQKKACELEMKKILMVSGLLSPLVYFLKDNIKDL